MLAAVLGFAMVAGGIFIVFAASMGIFLDKLLLLPEWFLRLSGFLMVAIGITFGISAELLSMLGMVATSGAIGCSAMQAPNPHIAAVIIPHVFILLTVYSVAAKYDSSLLFQVGCAYVAGGGYRCMLVRKKST